MIPGTVPVSITDQNIVHGGVGKKHRTFVLDDILEVLTQVYYRDRLLQWPVSL